MRMKFVLAAVAIASLLVSLPASANDWYHNWNKKSVRGSGNMVTVERNVETFTRIESNGSFDVHIVVGEEQSVKLTFDDNLVELITSNVRRGTLILDSKEGFSSRHSCAVEITVKELEGVSLDGSGDIQIENLKGESFVYEVNGSGSFQAEGEVKEIEINISGSGDVDTRHLKAASARVSIDGSGNAAVYASESIDGEINGSGDIRYYGRPTSHNVRVSGSGRISEGH